MRIISTKTSGFITLFMLLILSVSCQKSAVKMSPTHSADWDVFVSDFLEDYFVANPTTAIGAGRHEFDGQLPDWSVEGFNNEIARLHTQRTAAMAFDGTTLSDGQRFEREYLLSVIDGDLFWLETTEKQYRNPNFYQGHFDPSNYVILEYAPLDVRMQAYTKFAGEVPRAVEQIMENLRTPLPLTFVNLGHTTFGGYATYFENDIYDVFATVEDAQLQADLKEANLLAVEAMKKLDAWIEEQRPDATDGFAIGAENFQEMLWATERVDVSIADLKVIAQNDLARNIASLTEACAEYASGLTNHECVEKARSVKNEGGAVEGARQQLSVLRDFLIEKDLITIPGTEKALVAEAPEYARWNFAYINIPGPYEEGLPSTYYIAPPDPTWSEKDQHDYLPGKADLMFVSVHEIWPGHFLQFLHSNRSDSKFGQVFVGYAFAEGWAHYTEEMMWDAGFSDGDPEIHIGQLQNALLRNARFLSTIGLHTEGMTVEESEALFMESGFQDPGNARQQAARGTYDPAYLNYTMGKLMIKKLREDWTASRGMHGTWKAFHDRYLSFGGPPIPMIRKAMLGDDGGSLF